MCLLADEDSFRLLWAITTALLALKVFRGGAQSTTKQATASKLLHVRSTEVSTELTVDPQYSGRSYRLRLRMTIKQINTIVFLESCNPSE